MNELTFQRARSPEAKAARRAAIMGAAADLLAREGLEGTTLSAIAAEAGVVKSNIYRYFESREEILMRLLTKDLNQLSDALAERVTHPQSPREIAEILSAGLSANPRLCLLISITASTLERNISTETLREIKRDMTGSLTNSAVALSTGLPVLDQTKSEHAVHLVFILVAGLWPLSTPGPALQALYAEPEFCHFDRKFELSLTMAIETMLNGLVT